MQWHIKEGTNKTMNCTVRRVCALSKCIFSRVLLFAHFDSIWVRICAMPVNYLCVECVHAHTHTHYHHFTFCDVRSSV